MKYKHSKNKTSRHIKVISILLAIMLVLALTVPAFSAASSSENTAKQEVVYINLNSDGSVKEIYVVNIFELDEDGQITDYGKYSQLRNMTTNDKIQFEDETIRIDTNARKLYYERKLDNNAIPWDFSIRYYSQPT